MLGDMSAVAVRTRFCTWGLLWATLSVLTAASAKAQMPIQLPTVNGATGQAKPSASTTPAGGQSGAQGGDSKSASGSEEKDSEHTAVGTRQRLSPLDPAPAPPKVFSRPRIGLALGGGGALGLTEVGALKWFEENHIPVDVIAGTSMGCMMSALYAAGNSPDQMVNIVNDRVFTSVFSFSNSYSSRSFRRREDARELPNGITIGLKHGVSFRNGILVDQGLNAFLDREFLRYDDRTEFNTLPIPLRCVSTDLNEAQPVVFARGSIPDAVRASVSIPGVFPPFEMDGHEYVDGVVLENLPTKEVRAMKADVVLAFSLPLGPVKQGDLGSILGVLQRAFSVATEGLEREQRKGADVVITPNVDGYTLTDYLKIVPLAKRGYDATEAHRGELMKYALNDADWAAYLGHRRSLIHGPAAPVLRVRVTAPDLSARKAVQDMFAPLVNQPVNTAKIEALLDQVRADGAFDVDYTIGYESPQRFAAQTKGQAPLPSGTVPIAPEIKPGEASKLVQKSDNPAAQESENADRPGAKGLADTQAATAESLADVASRPVILVTVARKKIGPPFLLLGANLQAQTTGFTRAYVEGIVLDQDLGGYGSELRSDVKVGYLTEVKSEYFRPFRAAAPARRTFFVAPHGDFLRKPYPIFVNQSNVANRQLQIFSGGGDIGWTNKRTQELRAGVDFEHLSWETTIGNDGSPSLIGSAQRAHVRYEYDTQDRAQVPLFGSHVVGEFGYLYNAVNSPNTPQLYFEGVYSHMTGPSVGGADGDDGDSSANKNQAKHRFVFVISGQGGTMFNRNVAQPFVYTLGGPLRLSASAIDQYRGTDYFLLEPAILHRVAHLPSPLGQNIFLGLGLEAAQIRSPFAPTITREDGYFGFIAETPLGAITLAPAIGSNGERKFVFTLGKLF